MDVCVSLLVLVLVYFCFFFLFLKLFRLTVNRPTFYQWYRIVLARFWKHIYAENTRHTQKSLAAAKHAYESSQSATFSTQRTNRARARKRKNERKMNEQEWKTKRAHLLGATCTHERAQACLSTYKHYSH